MGNKESRIRNKQKNEQLKAEGKHPKQLRQKANEERAKVNKAIERRHGQPVTVDQAAMANTRFGVKFPMRQIKLEKTVLVVPESKLV